MPLVKKIAGNLSDVNNYRTIAISKSCSKNLDLVMYNCFRAAQPKIFDNNHQFGFKEYHSTGLCTRFLKYC